MPTDGADFGRMRACYGRAFTDARTGVDHAAVAEVIVAGLERDIRWDGGSPALRPLTDLLVLISRAVDAGRERRFFETIDQLRQKFADSPQTRHVAAAVEQIGLTCINAGQELSRSEASKMIHCQLARSRFGDPLLPYLTKNLTRPVAESRGIVDSILARVAQSPRLLDLSERMLNGSSSGLPKRGQQEKPIEHSASALNAEVLGEVI